MNVEMRRAAGALACACLCRRRTICRTTTLGAAAVVARVPPNGCRHVGQLVLALIAPSRHSLQKEWPHRELVITMASSMRSKQMAHRSSSGMFMPMSASIPSIWEASN